MSYGAGGPLARHQAAQRRQPRRPPHRLWVIPVAVVVLLVIAGNGGRTWWARWLGDRTGGNRAADLALGLLVGLLPLIAVAVASLGQGRRRPVRMLLAGAAGFVVTDLLAPSLTTAIRHSGGTATRPFSDHVPGYLTGVYMGIALEVLLLVVAVVMLRRTWRRRRSRLY